MIDHMAGRYSFALFGSLAYSAFLLIGSAGLTRAEERQEAPSGREQTVLAEKFTAERLWVWQKRLGLQDWRISVAVVPASELKPKTLGNIHWDLGKKTAMIHVLDPGDYHMPMKDMLKDMEFTVVHELIHLDLAPTFADLQRSDANRRDEEHAVNHVADALLRLDRQR